MNGEPSPDAERPPAPASVACRAVSPGDEELLYRIYASTRFEELAPVPWTAAQKEAFLRMQFRAQSVDYAANFPDAAFQVILVDGAPAGRLYVDRRGDELRIVDIALLPEHRGTGIGGALLRGLLAEAAAAGKAVRIHVEQMNPALRLYERLGFRRTGGDGVYFLMEWTAGAGGVEADQPGGGEGG
ncbi:MAG TPA: GNAT family N-acetyltransferase [Thermoanaerobaculia bacterium]|jgi:ribosomal protein S18 acetylase RimI-like enzyme|nr:GNAT family N-acetyltransferase [Thermoanaerobaculia bacterium]